MRQQASSIFPALQSFRVYECVYLNSWETVAQARAGLKEYFEFYNYERPHQSLDYETPAMVYYSKNFSGAPCGYVDNTRKLELPTYPQVQQQQ
jgi:hypothetical protein